METKDNAKATAEALSQKIEDDIEKTSKGIMEYQAKALSDFEAKHLKVPGLIGSGPLDKYADLPSYLRAMRE